MGDASLVDSVVGALTDPFQTIHMGVTAENLAKSHGISREAQDEFARRVAPSGDRGHRRRPLR